MPPPVGRPALVIGAIALAGVLAMPALAQELSPSPSDVPSPPASASPEASASEPASASLEPTATSSPSVVLPSTTAAPVASNAPSPAAASGEKDEDENESADPKEAETPPISVTGIIEIDATGKHPHYTLKAGSVVYELETGPWWFWGDTHPLAAFVGKAVTVLGQAEGEHGIEVYSANGTKIREPGKPPWAGGPWVQGEKHPGWKPWMAEGKPGKGPKGSAAP